MSTRHTLVALVATAGLVVALAAPRTAAAATHTARDASTRLSTAALVTGTVTDEATRRPVAGVQITVIGTTLGAMTDDQGRYRLAGVPAGSARLRAKRIGYVSVDRTITVEDGGTVTADFSLGVAPLSLDAVVVTGTPGGTQLRAIGNAIEKLDVAKAAEISPATNVQQLLGQRSPGVIVLPSSGMVGTGSAVRIRGAASLSLTSQPILYVDGVRVDNNPSAGPAIRQGRQAARLNDFNPEDIESMEIIKGPAAATLYGTEASNGVIQIITKRGRAGKPQFDITVKEGGNFLANAEDRLRYTYGVNPNTGKVDSVNMITNYKETTGRDVFTTGALHQINASMSGGTEAARYFVSADRLSNTGVVDYNWVHATSTRANLALLPRTNWQVNTNVDFVQNETRFAQAADQFGIWEMLVYSSPALFNTATKGFRYANPDVAASVDSRSKVNRFTGGVDIKNTPTSWLTHQLKVGADVGQTANQVLFPRLADGQINFYGARSTGEKSIENITTTFNTIDYAATAKRDFGSLTTATSFGTQYYRKQTTLATALGSNFPTTDVTTIGGAATTTAGEDFVENKTLGGYVQEQFGWNDRLFLTAALRGDANSAFGKDFKAAYYPKLSGAWVVSEEPFFHWKSVNTLRLRGAWGQAGQQPDTYDAVTLYQPTTGPGGVPILTPSSLGNTTLKPERGSELEVGFDAGFLEDRITTTFTHYNRLTTDAIVRQQIQPSSGFPGVRVVNLGKVKAWGNELGVNARVLESNRLGWDLGVNFSTAHNVIEDLGGLPPILVAGSVDQEHRVGFPVGSIFWYEVNHAEFDATGKLVNVTCNDGSGGSVTCANAPKLYKGQPTPTWSGSVSNSINIMQRLRLTALVDFQGGMTYVDGEIQAGHQNFQNTAASNPVIDPIYAAYQTVVPRTPLGLFDAGFAKLRELSASYNLPERFASRFGANNASLTGAWRNVAFLWRAQEEIYGTKLFDSEMRTPGTELLARYQTMIPPASQIVVTARLGF
jgi:TonB-linked SusC/RagA family outer membrane protein